MALFSVLNTRIEAISGCVPSQIFRNEDIPYLSPIEKSELIQNIGINDKRIVGEGVTTLDLCYECAKQIMESGHWDKDKIKVLVLVTQTPDYYTPASSIILQHRLGLGNDVIAFDINLGCSGYVYGLSVVASLLQNFKDDSLALLCVGDTSSTFIDEKDKGVFSLFSDAGSATLISKTPQSTPMYFDTGSDGKGFDAIIVENGGARNPFLSGSASLPRMKLDGLGIMHFALRQIPLSVQQLLSFAQMDMQDVDYVYLHQANKIINHSLIKKLKIPFEKCPETLNIYGNTSSATIPLTILNNHENLKEDTLNILCGFGVGLSWATSIVRLSECKLFPIIEK